MRKKKTKVKKTVYRLCPYCNRVIPSQYDFYEHKRICKNVYEQMYPK